MSDSTSALMFSSWSRRRWLSSCRSHLASLCHLYDYWMLTDTLPDHLKRKVTAMKQSVKRWMTSYRKNANQRHVEKLEMDLQKLITPDDISTFNESQTARDAVKILGAVSQNTDRSMSRQDYTMVRDYLLSATILQNANRPGVLASVTTQQVKEAKIITDHHVVSVPNHKTSSVHGPAKLVLTKLLYRWTIVFVTKFLPQVPAECAADILFRSFSGEPIDVGRCFQATMKKAGLRDDITCTLFRKSAVSAVHERCPGEKGKLADLMCHREDTATRWYRVVDKEKTSVQAAAKLAEVMNNNEAVSHRSHVTDVNTDYEQEQVHHTVQWPSSSHSACTSENTENSQSQNTENSQSLKASGLIRKKLFNDREICTINDCCSDIIDGGNMSKERIIAAMSRQEDGVRLLNQYSISQIITRVSYERRKRRLH